MVQWARQAIRQSLDKGKGTYTWYSASSWIITSEAIRYGTCSQVISQFYLQIHTFIRNRNGPYLLCLPSYSWYSFTDPGGMEGWVGAKTSVFSFHSLQISAVTVILLQYQFYFHCLIFWLSLHIIVKVLKRLSVILVTECVWVQTIPFLCNKSVQVVHMRTPWHQKL